MSGVGSTEKVGIQTRWVFQGLSLQAWKQPQERPAEEHAWQMWRDLKGVASRCRVREVMGR